MTLEWVEIKDNRERIIASMEVIQYLGDIINIYMSRNDDFPLRLAIQKCLDPNYFFILLKYVKEKSENPLADLPLSERHYSFIEQVRVNNLALNFIAQEIESIEIPDYLDGFITGIDKESYLSFVKTMDQIVSKMDQSGNLQNAIASVLSSLLEGK